MSGTDNMDEDMQLQGDSGQVSTDAMPFQGMAYPGMANSVGSNMPPRPGDCPDTAIKLNARMADKLYYMKHKKRGKAIIFNMEKIQKLEEREGSNRDVVRLTNSFNNLGFEVMPYTNITADALSNTLKHAATNADFDEDCLIVVFMSHGEAGDRLWASDRRFLAKELWEPFFTDNCPALAGKPKLFFIQACRGNQLAKGVFVRDAGGAPESRPTYTVPVQSDILVAQATFEEHQAVRHKTDGAWFIQSLCNELDENGRSESLLSMLTSVNRRVAIGHAYKKEENVVLTQQPVIMSTLTRELFF